MTHPIIGDPIIVIIMVTFITQAIFVMIFLSRVGKDGAVILYRNKGVVKEAIITIIESRWVIMAFCISVHVGPGYLLAVVGGVLHTQQVSVGPSIQITVLSANMTIPSISWLALTAEHGLRVDAQVDAVCIFMAVMATILARVAGFANLKKITESFKKNARNKTTIYKHYKQVITQTCFLAVACSTPLPNG